MRYQLTTQDRAKGGMTTASRYDMRERGRAGLQAFANKYFHGDTKKAGWALSCIGNWKTDPFPRNGAFGLPSWLPEDLRARIGAPLPDYGEIPF